MGFLFMFNSQNLQLAIIYLKITYFGVSLIPILFFHFIATYLYQNKKYKKFIYAGYFVALIFIFLFIATDSIIDGTRTMENFGRFESVKFFPYLIFLSYFYFFSIWAVYLLFCEYRINIGIRKRQIFYILLASGVGFVGGSFNFITNIFEIYPYGQMFVWLYPVLITYGIFIDKIELKIN
jgi:hypothetical protein